MALLDSHAHPWPAVVVRALVFMMGLLVSTLGLGWATLSEVLSGPLGTEEGKFL